ncbi:MAG: PIN domain-containing protein [Candidatus Nitrotoga sp.]
MDGIEIEYWDSCVFIALLQNEQHRLGEFAYLQNQARKFDMGAIGLVTSASAVAEIYESRLTEEQTERFRSMYTRSNFQFVDASFQICSVASEIRGYYKNNPIKQNGRDIYPSAPDAIHVASAIAAQVVSKQSIKLITFDSEDKPAKNEIGLTKISGDVAGKYQITICRPPTKGQQENLFA